MRCLGALCCRVRSSVNWAASIVVAVALSCCTHHPAAVLAQRSYSQDTLLLPALSKRQTIVPSPSTMPGVPGMFGACIVVAIWQYRLL